jgi:hypothetical protein
MELSADNFHEQVAHSAPQIAFSDLRTPITDMFWRCMDAKMQGGTVSHLEF